MDYKKIHDLLIDRAKERINEDIEYYEVHHILPKCIGGTDVPSNLVKLTPEEHFIIHMLLVKVYPKENSLWYAAKMMCNRNNKHYGSVKRKQALLASNHRKGKSYEEIYGYEKAKIEKEKKKKQLSENNPMKGRNHSEQSKELMKEAASKRIYTDELKFRIGSAMRGKTHTTETKEKMKDAISKRWHGKEEEFSEEQRRRASNPKRNKENYKKPKSNDTKLKMSIAAKERKRVACKICGKMVTKANIERHERTHK